MKQIFKTIIGTVIGTVIVSICGFFLSRVNWDFLILPESCPILFEPNVSYFVLIITIILTTLLMILIGVVIRKCNYKQNKIEKKLKKFNRWEDDENGVTVLWDVYIGQLVNNNPFISNIKFYCKRHKEGLLPMVNGCCPDANCPNHNIHLNELQVKHHIEEMLLLKKRELEGKK